MAFQNPHELLNKYVGVGYSLTSKQEGNEYVTVRILNNDFKLTRDGDFFHCDYDDDADFPGSYTKAGEQLRKMPMIRSIERDMARLIGIWDANMVIDKNEVW